MIYRWTDIEKILLTHEKYILPADVIDRIRSISEEIVPILVEKTYKKPEKKKEKEPAKAQNNIRTCLNKLSVKNYDKQKEAILELLKEETGFVKMIFDIASTNMFYAEIYARLYKELFDIYPEFADVLTEHLSSFASSVKDLKYVPETDYELHCLYNKQNDSRKATVVFIVYLMKLEVVSESKIISIVEAFQEMAKLYSGEDDRVNEVDEITEIIFLFVQQGILHRTAAWQVVLENITAFSTLKKGKSVSSRAVFKYLDIMKLI